VLGAAGYAVASVLGDDAVCAIDGQAVAAVDLIVIGFSHTYADRTSTLLWLKAQWPKIPAVALQADSFERFPQALGVALADDPKVWLIAAAAAPEHGQQGQAPMKKEDDKPKLPCPVCRGTGRYLMGGKLTTCCMCDGKGYIVAAKT
jgi:hypothetical protein